MDTLAGLGDGKIQVVTFADLIGEGVDIPAVAGVIMLRRTLSLALYLQIVGRALRPIYANDFDLETVEGRRAAQLAGPKPRAIVLDHAGNYGLHGHVLADRTWSLDSQKRKVKDETVPTTTACPKCYGVWPGKPRTCPACGFSFADKERIDRSADLRIIAGELIEAGVDVNEAENLAQFIAQANAEDAKGRQRMLLGRAFQLAVEGDAGLIKLQALAGAVGYSRHWTAGAWSFVKTGKWSHAV
jgi:superfamily II DNA or RNA helicase